MPKRKQAMAGKRRKRRPSKTSRELSRADRLARQMLKIGLNDDPAVVAAAIVIFATENIKRSSKTLPEARAYLDATRAAIDGLLLNAFPPKETAGKEAAG